ncbi:hypothetical protein F511_24768 [Dorcoceras hygrometricum]|uniref:Uncharacterized protein n=1 Tax=Dorcoceras hygrometricum TaxID=472368 RepID=A0A2Z7CIS9_9LAMI|nr:hypothetical protein F511_24768 [Dorcoceras hygrometricum]
MVKRLATSPHDPIGITDSACKNQLVVVSVQYGPFNTYIPIRSTIIDNIGYPRMKASGESSTIKHRLLHASGPHPIPPPNDPKGVGKRVKVRRLSYRVSMTFRVVRTNQYNQDLGLIHSTNGNHLESPNEGSSIDHQVTIHLHAQNITVFPTNETCSCACDGCCWQRRAIARVIEEATCVWFEEPAADEKRNTIKWKRCVLGIASGTSSEESVALFIQSRATVHRDLIPADYRRSPPNLVLDASTLFRSRTGVRFLTVGIATEKF